MTHTYRYDFNAKELQPELGLNWHDYHARNYDAALCRWMNVDLLGEEMPSWSPYNYAFNNPVYFIDPDGRMPQESGGCGTANNPCSEITKNINGEEVTFSTDESLCKYINNIPNWKWK